MAKRKRTSETKPLTIEESKELKGSAYELKKAQKAKEAKIQEQKYGTPVENVVFQKGELKEGTRVVGEPEKSESPKQQLKRKPKPLPKAKPRPTVGRGTGGRIISLKKTKPISKRKQTRTGKKIDRATGKIAVPLVRRDEQGRAVGTTAEERAATVTTVLPEAGREVMQPTPRVLTPQPGGTLGRGGQRRLRGFGMPHARVKAAVDAAIHHLDGMKSTQGTPEFDDHEKAFDAIHANIQGMDKHGLGITVGQLKHQTLTGGAKAPHILRLLHTRIQDRLEEGRMAEEENKQRIQEGRDRRAGGDV